MLAIKDTIKNKLSYELLKIRKRRNLRLVEKYYHRSTVATIDETLEMLLNSDCSMCRYGDGEYKVMVGRGNGFQISNSLLAKRLRQVIRENELGDKLIICIPDMLGETEIRTSEAASFWRTFALTEGKAWVQLLNPKGKYYNALVTRLYMDYRNSGRSEEWFTKLKMVWDGKKILIVEGEKTRLGVGNDLFENTKSIKRIIAPSQNAFLAYDKILETVKQKYNNELILIALGQTATVLAYDLFKLGYRALDIGHIDIEYEWYLAKASKKTSVIGKYVKEVDASPVDSGEVEKLEEYRNQIIAEIKG